MDLGKTLWVLLQSAKLNEEYLDSTKDAIKSARSFIFDTERYEILRDKVIWAVTNYGSIPTDKIINELRTTLDDLTEDSEFNGTEI